MVHKCIFDVFVNIMRTSNGHISLALEDILAVLLWQTLSLP